MELDARGKPKTGRSPRWPAVARAHLAAHPECEACGRSDDLVVHHKVPVHVDQSLELEPANLATLCEGDTLNCHLWCGHLGHWRSWNPSVDVDAARFRLRVATRPWQ